jgi:hypothetical protein
MSTRLGFDATGTTDGCKRYHDRPPDARKICDLGPTTSTPKKRLLANRKTARMGFAEFRCRKLFTWSIFVVLFSILVGTIESACDESGSQDSPRHPRHCGWTHFQKLRLGL